MSGAELIALAARVEAATDTSRELADEVLLACGWRLNHDADDIAAWRVSKGFASEDVAEAARAALTKGTAK